MSAAYDDGSGPDLYVERGDDLCAVIELCRRPLVALRALGGAAHQIARNASIDLEEALAIVVAEARDIQRFNETQGRQALTSLAATGRAHRSRPHPLSARGQKHDRRL